MAEAGDLEVVRDQNIPSMIDEIRTRCLYKATKDFLDALEEIFDAGGFITERQYDVLVDMYYGCEDV